MSCVISHGSLNCLRFNHFKSFYIIISIRFRVIWFCRLCLRGLSCESEARLTTMNELIYVLKHACTLSHEVTGCKVGLVFLFVCLGKQLVQTTKKRRDPHPGRRRNERQTTMELMRSPLAKRPNWRRCHQRRSSKRSIHCFSCKSERRAFMQKCAEKVAFCVKVKCVFVYRLEALQT